MIQPVVKQNSTPPVMVDKIEKIEKPADKSEKPAEKVSKTVEVEQPPANNDNPGKEIIQSYSSSSNDGSN